MEIKGVNVSKTDSSEVVFGKIKVVKQGRKKWWGFISTPSGQDVFFLEGQKNRVGVMRTKGSEGGKKQEKGFHYRVPTERLYLDWGDYTPPNIGDEVAFVSEDTPRGSQVCWFSPADGYRKALQITEQAQRDCLQIENDREKLAQDLTMQGWPTITLSYPHSFHYLEGIYTFQYENTFTVPFGPSPRPCALVKQTLERGPFLVSETTLLPDYTFFWEGYLYATDGALSELREMYGSSKTWEVELREEHPPREATDIVWDRLTTPRYGDSCSVFEEC